MSASTYLPTDRPWTRDEWLEWASEQAARNLRDGQAFGVSAPRERSRVMYQASKMNLDHIELGSRVKAEFATVQEV